MDTALEGLHALVCGGSRGIGRACARTIAALGARVTILARDEQALIATADSLPYPEREHGWLAADFNDSATLQGVLQEFAEHHAPVSILVNNSGGPPAGLAHEAALAELEAAFRQHVIGGQLALQALLPGMKQAGYGRVINIISTSIKEPIAGLGVSNIIRGAVANWAKTLADELGSFGITVNNVLPGFTRTDRLARLFASRAEKESRPLAEIEAAARQTVPLRRFAEPEEVAAAVAFLASPAAAYINGINLPVDGGRTKSL
ncbi:SDR family oxidoreductase [soil metagenome]